MKSLPNKPCDCLKRGGMSTAVKGRAAMDEFELVDISTLLPRRMAWLRFCGFLSLLNVAANRWMEGLPVRVFNLKQ